MGSRTFILVIFLTLAMRSGGARSEQGPPWKSLDGPQPPCERPLSLEVGEEFFFEIANDLPGQNAYNELVALYHRKKWDVLDTKLQGFRKAFESSALNEAATYLEVQSLFDRLPSAEATVSPLEQEKTSEGLKKAERALRDALLLYPQSRLAPVVSATAGIYWLRTSRFQRALAFFEASAVSYPKSPVECIFQLGMGESSFWLGDWKAAEKRLTNTLENCRNFRLRTAAELRLAETRWHQGKPDVENEIEKILDDQSPYVERFYPAALFNFGEMKYRRGDFRHAKFYFDRFLKKQPKSAACSPEALKRIADISLMLGEPLDVVAGKYLTVRDVSILGETGKFAYAHALLLTLALAGKVEYGRRIKVVDDILEKFKEGPQRSRLFLEKGLAMLSVGELEALDYLARLKPRQGGVLEEGPVVEYVRNQVSKYAASIQDGPPDKLRNFLEAQYDPWIKDSLHQSLAWHLYEMASVHLFADQIEAGKFDEAFGILEEWKKTDFWPRSGPSEKARDLVSVALLRGLFSSDGPDAPLALDLLQRGTVVRPFLEPEFDVVEIAAASQVGDERRMKQFFDGSQRQIASTPTSATTNSVAKSYLMMARARALRISNDTRRPNKRSIRRGKSSPHKSCSKSGSRFTKQAETSRKRTGRDWTSGNARPRSRRRRVRASCTA